MREISGFEKGGRWLLAAALAGAALAAGTVHTVTLCIVSAALAVAAALTWWNAENLDFRPRQAATLLVATGVVLTGYTALQTVPMPMGWLSVIAPHNADIWSRALTPLHEPGPRWAPISLDPNATRIEVLKGVAYLLAFVTALRIARTRDGIGFLSTVVVVTGAVVATAALLHPAFGARRLYGVWAPSAEVYDRHVAPFLNPNNLAGYLNVAFCLAFAAALATEPRWPRPLVIAATLLLAATQIWVASRGGVASMVLGATLVIVISRAHRLGKRRRQATSSSISWMVALSVVAGIGMVVLASSKQTSDELFDRDVSKFGLLRQAIQMVPSYPIFGTGRGAFQSAFPAFRTSAGPWTFTHPENVLAQWVIEWGVPVGFVGLACIVFGLRPNTVLARSSTAAGAWAGLLAVAVQNLVDLGSETPGLVLAPVVCAAIVVGGTAGSKARWRIERWGQSPRGLAASMGLATVLAIVGAASGIGSELDDDRAALQKAAVAERATVGSTHARAEFAMLRHPAEPYLPFIVAWRAARERDDDAMAWIEATLERSRLNGQAHLVLARLLSRRSPAQARLEYRVAMDQGMVFSGSWATELPPLVGGYDDCMELVSQGPVGAMTLRVLIGALAARLPATSARLNDELATREPTDPEPPLRVARNAVADLEAGESAPWCNGPAQKACVTRALDATALAERIAPATTCEPYILRARARIAASDARTGLSELAGAAETASDRVGCLEALAVLAERALDEERASAALTKLAASGCSVDAECAARLAWVAATEERRGNGRQALILYKRAADRAPERDDLLEAAARLAASAGLHGDAQRTYERLAHRHPEEPKWQKSADAEHDALLRAAASR